MYSLMSNGKLMLDLDEIYLGQELSLILKIIIVKIYRKRKFKKTIKKKFM